MHIEPGLVSEAKIALSYATAAAAGGVALCHIATATREKGIASVKENAPKDERYERKTAKSGSPMFNLKAANGQVIGTSETYSSESARDNGIASVKTNAPAATTEDKT